MAPKLAFGPSGELYAVVMRASGTQPFDASTSTLTVFKYALLTTWARWATRSSWRAPLGCLACRRPLWRWTQPLASRGWPS
jgi:hypothetical protein